MKELTITVDFEGSNNITLDTNFKKINDLCVEATIAPLTRHTVLIVKASLEEGYGLSTSSNVSASVVANTPALSLAQNKISEEIVDFTARWKNFNSETSIIDWCVENKLYFIDVDFLPVRKSLFGEKESDKCVQWRRASTFMKYPKLFTDGIDIDDVIQGELGNCWFLASITCIAERLDLVNKLFFHCSDEVHDVGIFFVRLCIAGVWHPMYIDDYIPCKPHGEPIFTSSRDINECWVMVLEKAYAKYFGSYLALKSGDSRDGMTDLTGCPTGYYDFKDEESVKQTWKIIEESCYNDENLITLDIGDRSDTVEMGLILAHAYSLLDFKQSNDGLKLVRLRNPWGQTEWKGAYSDHSNLWTSELKALCGFDNNPDDGSFWMCQNDFQLFYKGVSVCFCNPNWKDIRIPLELGLYQDDSYFFKMNLNVTDGHVKWVGLHQSDIRSLAVDVYTDFHVLIFKQTDDSSNPEPLYFFSCCDRDAFYQIDLPPNVNPYEVYVFNSGNNFDPNKNENTVNGTLTFHYEANKECTFSSCYTTNSKLLKNLLLIYTKAFGQKTATVALGDYDCVAFYEYSHFELNIWAVGINSTDDFIYNSELQCEIQLQNKVPLYGMGHTLGTNNFDISIQDRQERLLFVAITKDQSEPSQFANAYGASVGRIDR